MTIQDTFTQNIIRMGREHGFALGLARAIELLRQHGIEVDHPARQAVFAALMREKPTED
jgi:nitrogen-specific signal transduction histidine kinase